MKLIMACVDLSQTTNAVITTAAELARATGARLIIAHVKILPCPVMYGEMMAGVDPAEVCGQRIRETRTQLDSLRDRLYETQGGDVTTLLSEGIKASPLLLAEAERARPDLIVMGSHGHGLLERWLVGSTCQEVIRAGKWPVLVVPSPKTAATCNSTPQADKTGHWTYATA